MREFVGHRGRKVDQTGRYSRKVASASMLTAPIRPRGRRRRGDAGRASCSSSCGPGVAETAHDWWSLRDEGDWSRTSSSSRRSQDCGRTTRCCRRRAWTTQPGSRPTGSGSSTRSTAPASSARRDAATGPSTSRWSTATAGRSPARSRFPPSGLTLGTEPAPPPPPAHDGPPRIVVSRTRPPAVAHSRRRGARRRAGRRWAPPAPRRWRSCSGEADVYAHAGGQYEWDSCAPVAVALAAGLHVSRHRRIAARLQPTRPVASRPAHLPARVGGGRDQRCHELVDLHDLKVVRYEIDGGVALVTLHRPDRLNAWTGRMHTEYRWVMAEAERDDRTSASSS